MYTPNVPANGGVPHSAPAPGEPDYTLIDFLREFPDRDACLEMLWRERHSPDGAHALCRSCARERRFHRTRSRLSYTCDSCGLHVHPMTGTIFERSTTPLELWFYAIYLMAATHAGISARQLQRELGVSHRTAQRMIARISSEVLGNPAARGARRPHG
jgi:transposase-like protein